MAQRFANNVSSFLNGALDNAVTAVNITPGTGVKFPTLTAGDFFLVTLTNHDESAHEIIKVTGVSADSFTVQRGYENTQAKSWPSGSRVELRLTAGTLERITNEIAVTKSKALAATALAL